MLYFGLTPLLLSVSSQSLRFISGFSNAICPVSLCFCLFPFSSNPKVSNALLVSLSLVDLLSIPTSLLRPNASGLLRLSRITFPDIFIYVSNPLDSLNLYFESSRFVLISILISDY